MDNDERWTGYWWRVVVGGVAICRVAVGEIWVAAVPAPAPGIRALAVFPWCRSWRAGAQEGRLPS